MKRLFISIFIIVVGTGFIFSQSITLIQPNGGGGQALIRGEMYVIQWTASGTTNPFKITLWKGGTQVGILKEKSAGNGERNFNWKVGELDSGAMVDNGTGYSVKVKEKTTAVADESNGTFEIKASNLSFHFTPLVAAQFKPHSIKITEPSGRDLALNSRMRILWSPKNLTNNVKISLMKNGELFGVIEENLAPGRISTEWTIGRMLIKTATPDSGFKIKIEEMGTAIFAESNAFSIIEEKNIDLSCYISGHSSRDYGRVVRLIVKVRINNFGGPPLARVPVQVSVRTQGSAPGSGERQTKYLENVTYRGHSYEYSLIFDFRLHSGSRYSSRRLLDRVATVVVDPEDTFHDRRPRNNTSTREFSF